MVVTGRGGCGRDVADGSGGVTDGGGGVDGHDGNRDGISWWEDNSENITFGTEPNETLYYALGLEHHLLIMSTLGDPGGQLEK